MIFIPENNKIITGSLLDILSLRAQSQPDKQAYIYLPNGESESGSLTYGELDTKARAIASHLQYWQGERALLLYPSGLEFITAFFGCLYAGIVAVPVYPPRRNQKLSRLLAIVNDAQAKVALTTTSILAEIEKRWEEEAELAQFKWVVTDAIEANSQEFVPKSITPESLAFLQYTSGSTGTPKGVMVTHENIIHNQGLIHSAFGHSEKSIGVGWLPLFHDMGLIGHILQPIYGGFPSILMSPVAFLQKPIRWLQVISKYRATTSGGPNFAYDLCIKKVQPEQLANLDLSSWDLAFNGAEPVRAETLEQFGKKFAVCGFNYSAFYPCYGMAETTLFATGGDKNQLPVIKGVLRGELEQNSVVESEISDPESLMFVGVGRPYTNTKVIIVNPESLTRCEKGQVGEIWVTGESVASGYWNRTEATQETFQAYLKDSGDEPFLRTGDLGFLLDDELFVTGRIKDVIIVRGRNHYPQDIELSFQKSHGALRPNSGAAFSVEVEGEERLVVVQEVERTYVRQLNSGEVVEAINQAVSLEHELAIDTIVLLKPGSIPKTSSGKIQRSVCRQKFLDGSLQNVVFTKADSVLSNFGYLNQLRKLANGISDKQTNEELQQQTINPVKENLSLANSEELSKSRANDLIKWLRSYASERINSRLIDERRCIPPYIVLDFGNRGLLGMQVPPEYGGVGLNYRDTLRVFEQLAAIDLTLASFVGDHHVLGTRPIMNYANETVRKESLPLIAKGRELAGFAITEPVAGSNPRAISATAVPDRKDGWRLSGQKAWIGHGSWAGTINVFVQTLDTNHKPIGISGFVVRQGTKGLRQGPEALTMGMRGMVQNSIYLQDVPVSAENLLGEVGKGMEVAQDTMMFARLGLGAMSLGGMKRCAQLMLRYSKRRLVATGRLLDNPVTLVRLSNLTAAITALETLVFKIAELLDRGEYIPEEAYTACKTSGPEFLWEAADKLIQLLGGRGYIETNIAPQILRDARLLRIFEGPTETLNMFLGSRTINKGEELQQFLSEGLGMPSVAQSLKAAVEKINEYIKSSKSSFSDDNNAVRWVYFRTGELTTFAILLATVQRAFEDNASEDLRHALNWAKLQFEQKLKSILSETTSLLVVENTDAVIAQIPDVDTIAAQICDYAKTIGNLEQKLAGEDHELDELLRCQASNIESLADTTVELNNNENDGKSIDKVDCKPLENNFIYGVDDLQNLIKKKAC